MAPSDLIKRYSLQPHPEGVYYTSTYQASMLLSQQDLPSVFKGDRPVSSAIYYLLEKGDFSSFHRIASDECWHFYSGDALEVIEIDKNGNEIKTKLGGDTSHGECFQYTVKAGHWFGSRVYPGGTYSLVGCTVSPGFDFRDFEMAKRDALLSAYPSLSSIIKELTRA